MKFVDVTLAERKKDIPEEETVKLSYDWRYENRKRETSSHSHN